MTSPETLSTLYPQLEIISHSSFTEYRYYNWSNHKRSGARGAVQQGVIAWSDAISIAFLAIFCYQSQGDQWRLLGLVGWFLYIYWRCTAVIYESIIVLPPHGIQLETHRGPLRSLFVARRFIPSMYIQDIIINEALRRWNVRYYLAVMVNPTGKKCELAVVFENTLPHFPVLLKVYRGMKDALYEEAP